MSTTIAPPAESGLRHNILSPLETLSQSISAIAPTTSSGWPAMGPGWRICWRAGRRC